MDWGAWPLVLLGVILAGPVVCGMSQAANDWCDRHVDAVNEPHRPIPSGRIPGRWGLWIALAMSGLAEQVRSHQMSDLAQQFRRLGRMAENLGMVSLATVASDLTICLHRSDATAFAAVWARLLRIAECSLACETDLMDKTLV